MKRSKQIESLLAEIVGEWGVSNYEVGIDNDSFRKWTITLYYWPKVWLPRMELGHWHTDDLVKGFAQALVCKQEHTEAA